MLWTNKLGCFSLKKLFNFVLLFASEVRAYPNIYKVFKPCDGIHIRKLILKSIIR